MGRRNTNFRLLHGSECDILADGKLDYPDSIRREFSHVVGSVHAMGYGEIVMKLKMLKY